MNIADLTASIRAPAWSILHLLTEVEPDFAPYVDGRHDCDLDTFAWYNGRERGFVLVLGTRHPGELSLRVAFGECRGSDSLFVDCWEGRSIAYDVPTWEEAGYETAYENRRMFSHSQRAADFIVDQMEKWWKRKARARKRKGAA